MVEGRKWGHDELQDDLAAYLRGNTERMVWTNMQLGPAGSPRPDCYTLEKRYANWNPVAFECKISTSDFRSDVTSGKWQSYLKFSTAVVFAAPAGLLTSADVPPTCGLILRGAETWRYARKPIHSPLNTLPREAWMKLLIDGVNRTTTSRSGMFASIYSAEITLRRRCGEEVATYVKNKVNAEERLEQLQGLINNLDQELRERRAAAERGEVAAYSEIRRRLARLLRQDDDATLESLCMHLEDRVKTALAACIADNEVVRLQSIIDAAAAAIEGAAKNPGTMAIPYWWNKTMKEPEL